MPATIDSDIRTLCYTADEVAAALEFYAARDARAVGRHEEMGKIIREQYFEPVTKEGTRRFLHLPVE